MEQIGVVNKAYDNMATVQIKRVSACGGKCGECGGCENTSHIVEAFNAVGAKTGQIVKMEMKDTKILFAAFMVYIIPLIMLFVGYVIGYTISTSELIAGGIGVILLILSFVVLKIFDRRIEKTDKYRIVITKIIT
ncbi:SoxR reducing system RseC family protein [Petroclostridium sp. X23]|uniref:SoxR reducing system RseC family protein n=1 Tax=Petroclostridium sp. X23 TaxID=3045146 RepID=UPI0024ADDB33|nr:SoxR reducing system RseC family protein [Petroclostridium sp. X23]WHH59628.1 SoxR reducing system RseC family protein [Petroclostridium sp. X23]